MLYTIIITCILYSSIIYDKDGIIYEHESQVPNIRRVIRIHRFHLKNKTSVIVMRANYCYYRYYNNL